MARPKRVLHVGEAGGSAAALLEWLVPKPSSGSSGRQLGRRELDAYLTPQSMLNQLWESR